MVVMIGVRYSSLICISLIIDDVEHLVVGLLANCMSLENVYLGLLSIFNWIICLLLLSFMSYFYVLEIKPLLVAMFVNIVHYFIDCLFVLFMGLLWCVKACKLD